MIDRSGHSQPVRRIIFDNATLRANYQELKDGDAMLGRVRLAPGEEHLLLDLVERGVYIFPAALAQLASRSKVMQARIFSEFMPAHTHAVHDLQGLLEVVSHYGANKIGRVITKQDKKNAGMGINLWESIEDVFNQCSCKPMDRPLVVQPFMADCIDLRVIVLGDYLEAYQRSNPNNFRSNLHFGGQSEPCELSEAQLDLCRRVMERGKFPYGHIDLLVTRAGITYLSEINLRGGIRGARITPSDYNNRLASIHESVKKDRLRSQKK